MLKNEQSLDLKIKGISLRAYFIIQNDKIILNKLFKLPILKNLVPNNEGNYVIIDIHNNTNMILIRKTTIINEIMSNILYK